MIKSIIIDDEEKSIQSLTWELTTFCKEVEIVASFTNPEEAIEFLRQNAVDCVFLDVEMPSIDGLQFLNNFVNRNFLVIIVSAYDQYAIKAIKKHVFDYLLKPVDSDDLKKTVNSISKELLKRKNKDDFDYKLNNLLNRDLTDKKIKISVDGKILFIATDEINYCKSDGNYCEIYLTSGKKIFLTQKLKFLEGILPESIFLRVHNSYIVNLNKVKSYDKALGYVVIENQIKIAVSRQKKTNFLDKI